MPNDTKSSGSSPDATPVRCNHCHGRGTVKPAGGISRVCAWCDGLGFEKQDAIPNSAAKTRREEMRHIGGRAGATRNHVDEDAQLLYDFAAALDDGHENVWDVRAPDRLRKIAERIDTEEMSAVTGRATRNSVTLDDRRRGILVAALKQHADTLRFTVATDRHHRREMDADAAIAEMLATAYNGACNVTPHRAAGYVEGCECSDCTYVRNSEALVGGDDVCDKPHAGDPDPCDCGYPGDPHATRNSAADPYLDTSTTSKARNATHRRLRADVDATRNRVWDYPTIYAAILNSINRSGYRIDGPNQDSDVNASDLADCIVTELLEGDEDNDAVYKGRGEITP